MDRSETWAKRIFHSRQMREFIQRCITFRNASVVKPLTSMTFSFQLRKLSELEPLSCWMNIIRTFEIFELER